LSIRGFHAFVVIKVFLTSSTPHPQYPQKLSISLSLNNRRLFGLYSDFLIYVEEPVFDLYNFQRGGRISEICMIRYFRIVHIPG